jgi:nucleotide-binding universal stress UspA family protein
MAASKTYLVPVDFSKSSEIALNQAIKMARENRGKLLLVHVISATFAFPLKAGFSDIFETLEKNARKSMKKLLQRKRLKPTRDRSIFITGLDPAQAIVSQAKKSRASMIIMGSHGRTGLQKFLLGSVAERTLRYAHCPVLIVKK